MKADKAVEQSANLEAKLAAANKKALKARVRSLRGLYSSSPIPNKKELSRIFYENAIS
ncbi:MAG: hypothetical protein FWH22_08605 [Fibromonadales bacterium]|nr:hypothetical protein [Fibromonadales bacterium]